MLPFWFDLSVSSLPTLLLSLMGTVTLLLGLLTPAR